MKKISLFMLTLFCSSLIYSQVTQEWVKRYNAPADDYDAANSIAIDNSGNVYITGVSRGSGSDFDYCTIKYNSAGVQQWVQRYNGTGNGVDQTRSIAVDNLGNVYVTGGSEGSGSSSDYFTIKYSTSGIQQWTQRYNAPGNGDDEAYSVAVDNSGNVYVTGHSMGSSTNSDYCTIKYNSAGAQQWVRRYNGPGNGLDFAHSIAVDNAGNVYLTGWSEGSSTNSDYCTIKYNSAGAQQWVRRYNGPGNGSDMGYSIAVDVLGNAYVTGQSTGSGTHTDYCTIKYNVTSAQQWIQRYNGPGDSFDNANSIAVDNSGNVYVTGRSEGTGANNDYCTIKYDSSGLVSFVKRYDGPANDLDEAYSIAVDNSGNVYVTGHSMGNGTNFDYCTIKYDILGVEEWVERYNGPGNSVDHSLSVAIDNTGGIYVTGGSISSGTNYDYCTIKYQEPIGVQPISNEAPDSYELSQNYPNPFNPITKIKFEIPESSLAKLAVFDIFGRELAVLVNGRIKPGVYEVSWDAGNVSSGIYFYKLITADYFETRKMVLIK